MRPHEMTAVDLGDEQTQKPTNVQGYITQYNQQPATGIPAHTNSWSTPPPVNAWHSDPAAVPFASFEQSAPYSDMPISQPLPCWCGIQWTIFCIGFLIWPLWYVGAGVKFCTKPWDPREKNGWIANTIMSFIFTIVWIALLATSDYNDYWHSDSPQCMPDPITGLCI